MSASNQEDFVGLVVTITSTLSEQTVTSEEGACHMATAWQKWMKLDSLSTKPRKYSAENHVCVPQFGVWYANVKCR